MFIGRTDAEAETPIFWPPDVKSWLTGKDPDAGKDWRQEEKGTTGWETGRMASPTQWTWIWVNSKSWWWTGRPGVLQSIRLQRVGNNWTEWLNWNDWTIRNCPNGAMRKKIKYLRMHEFMCMLINEWNSIWAINRGNGRSVEYQVKCMDWES